MVSMPCLLAAAWMASGPEITVTCPHFQRLVESSISGATRSYGFCELGEQDGLRSGFYLPGDVGFHVGEALVLSVVPAAKSAFSRPDNLPGYLIHETLHRSGKGLAAEAPGHAVPAAASFGIAPRRALQTQGELSLNSKLTVRSIRPETITILTVIINYNDGKADQCDEDCWIAQTFTSDTSLAGIYREASYGAITFDQANSKYVVVEMGVDRPMENGAHHCPHQEEKLKVRVAYPRGRGPPRALSCSRFLALSDWMHPPCLTDKLHAPMPVVLRVLPWYRHVTS